ncbi:GIY-YIG nuclease family protein [Paracrocinitomix mangrovi]|nr:GIY-YIG nuclease family protein [Paracrocinitomix mangrovi]UKN01215.1 GIY-YIG nuclease family protein [Paracrocinitomix mangrovi]
MTFYVYILYSEKFDKFYIGQTNNLSNRLKRHNEGQVLSTKHYNPWQIAWFCEKESRSESMILEKKLKNLNRKRLLEFISKYS